MRPLAERFDAAGHRLYLVGGIVRDLVLGPPADDGDIDLTTDARPEVTTELVHGLGRRRVGPGRPLRHGRRQARRHRPSRSPPTGPRPTSPTPASPRSSFADDVEADLSRRDFTVNAMALRVTGADGEAPELIDPFGGVADLAAGRAAHAAGARGVVQRRPAPHAAGGPLPRRLRPAARAGAGRRRRGDGRPPRDRVGRAGPRRAGQAARGRRTRATGSGSSSTPGSPTSSSPSCPAMRVEQDPIHRHKDVLAHTIAVVAKTSPDARAADGRAAPRRRQAEDPLDRARRACRSTTTRWSAPAWPATACGRCASRTTRSRTITQLVYLHLRFHGYGDDVWTDAAVRRYVRDAGPAARRAQRAHPLRLHHPQRAQGPACWPPGWTRSRPASPSCASARSSRPSAPTSTAQAVMAHLGIAAGPRRRRGPRHAPRGPPRRGPARARTEAYRRLDAWWAARGLSSG